jgi:hypothetical protein
LHHINGKLGTHDLAQTASDTRFGIRYLRDVIAFSIKGGGHAQHVARAIGLAQTTTLATGWDDGDLPARNQYLVMI